MKCMNDVLGKSNDDSSIRTAEITVRNSRYTKDQMDEHREQWTSDANILYSCGQTNEYGIGFKVKNDMLPFIRNLIIYNKKIMLHIVGV